MSGYQGRGGDYGRPDRYGGRDSRGRRDDPGDNIQERRRSRSPRRDHSRGGGFNRGRNDGNRGGSGHDGRGGSSGNMPFKSKLPPLPTTAPFPEGAGGKVPYPNMDIRGKIGKKARFLVNHHAIETLPIIKIFQYDLRFKVPPSSQARGSDKVTAQQMARVLVHTTLVNFLGPNFVFDGVSLGWSPSELMATGQTRNTTISLGQRKDNKPNEVEIEITCSGTLDIWGLVQYLTRGNIEPNPSGNPDLENQLKWLQAVFRSDIQTRMVSRPNSNAFFDRSPGTTMALQSTAGVLEARRGIFQTMQLRFQMLTMNVDTATTPFWVPDKSLIDCICALMRVNSLDRLEAEFLKDAGRFFQACGKLLGMFFNVRHLNEMKNAKKIKFQAWSREDAITSQFEEEVDGSTQSTSVKEYFQRKYGIRLQFPRLPLAKTRAGEFPLELCYSAADERYREVLQGAETADFIKFATAPAYVRRQQIIENTKMVAWHNQSTLRAHGLSVNPNMMVVKALILPSPQIVYGSSVLSPSDGQWNLRGLRFLRPSTIRSWALVLFSHTLNPALKRFTTEIIKGFRSLGMGVPNQSPAIMLGNPFGDIKSVIESAIGKAQSLFGLAPDLIFLLIQGTSVPLYTAVKNSLDVNKGIASQVMLIEKALKDRGQQQYIANIAMKVNVKLGGTNCTIHEPLFKENRWMLIGGDLSMGSPSAIQCDPPPPTTVALTGTYDKRCTAYTAVANVQKPTQTGIIENAGIMFKELLTRYKDRNNGLMPQHIIYYRDGASESEFTAIRDKEGLALRQLCKEFETKITIIVAVKRHHTRFMAEGEFATKLGNVPPGTVVENSMRRNDAYIVTQRDLQGTKRPTRYISIVDENQLSADDFNRLIYGLCSTYARATTSVAVVPPIYYADQACERSRLHLQDKQDGTKFLPRVHENLSWRMYWQ